jgi:hypothetical protein
MWKKIAGSLKHAYPHTHTHTSSENWLSAKKSAPQCIDRYIFDSFQTVQVDSQPAKTQEGSEVGMACCFHTVWIIDVMDLKCSLKYMSFRFVSFKQVTASPQLIWHLGHYSMMRKRIRRNRFGFHSSTILRVAADTAGPLLFWRIFRKWRISTIMARQKILPGPDYPPDGRLPGDRPDGVLRSDLACTTCTAARDTWIW